MTIQRVTKTDSLIESFKTWDGAAWFRHHLAWLKGSYQMAQGPKARAITKPPRVKTIPFQPNVSHASSEIREFTGLNDKEWLDHFNNLPRDI